MPLTVSFDQFLKQKDTPQEGGAVNFDLPAPGATRTSTPTMTERSFGPAQAVALPFQMVDFAYKRAQLIGSKKLQQKKTPQERMKFVEKQPGISEVIPHGLRQIPGYQRFAKAGGELLAPRPKAGPEEKVVPTITKLLSLGTVDLEHPVQSVGKISETAFYSAFLDPAVRTSVVKDLKAIQTGFVDDLVSKGYTREEAIAFSKEGGFLGRFNPKIKALEDKFDDLARAKAKAPTAAAAKRYEKAQQAVVKRIRQEQQSGFHKIPGMGGDDIPEFKGAREAAEFGSKNKDNPNVVSKLGELYDDAIAQAKKLQNIPGKENEAYKLSLKAQGYREALDAASGKLNLPSAVKERKFITSAKEAPGMVPEVKARVTGTYEPITNRATFAKAQRFVDADETGALLKLSEGRSAIEKVGADYTATAEALAFKYQQAGRFDDAAKVINDAAETLTKAGQTVQAANMLGKLSPEGVLAFAQRQMGTKAKLTPDLAKQLVAQAEKIQRIPASQPYQKVVETQELAGMIERNIPKSLGQKAKNWLFELWTLPKSTAASLDFSAAMRQGGFPLSTFPKEWGRAFKAQFKAAGSKEGYANLMNDVMRHSRFNQAMQAKVSFTDVAAKLGPREDRFVSTWAEKIPGFGKLVGASNRAYTGFLNKLRMDMFGRMADDAERIGVKIDEKWLREAGRFINDATGRGAAPLKSLERASGFLQGIMFSPRLMYSRLNILASPVSYINSSPTVRAQLWKSLFGFASSGAAVIGLLDLIPGVDVGKDPRSADFGKVKVGNTRFDLWGGFQQYLRIAAQVVSGKYVSTTTGKVITLGEGYRPLTRKDILLRGFESKEAPWASLISTMLTGKNFKGEDIDNLPTALKEIANRFTPMALNDLWEVYKNDPGLLPFGFLGMFGVGVQSYPQTEAIEEMKRINVSADPKAEFEKLKKENPILAEKVQTAKQQENFTEFDWALTYMGVENGERAKFLTERLRRISPEERTALMTDLKKKRLVSGQVEEQMRFLWSNPDYVIPGERK